MFGSVRETLKQVTRRSSTFVRSLETLPSVDSRPTISKSKGETSSFAISYFMKSCGLSPDKAIATSKLVDIQGTEKPDLVLELLRSHGFTQAHIASLISRYPRVLLLHPERILKPKIQFVESFGIVGVDLAGFLSSDAQILGASLKKRTMPTFDWLRRIFQTEERKLELENPVKFFKLLSMVLRSNVQKVIVPNMSTLCLAGVPKSHIPKLLKLYPRAISHRVDSFEEVVNEVKRIGFRPKSNNFILALGCFSVIGMAKKVRKLELLLRYGWSEEEFHAALRVQPMLMGCSAEKIKVVMDFFIKEVGLTPSVVARCPNVFLVSFHKRIVPRWLLLKALISKGLMHKDMNINSAFTYSQNTFHRQYVVRFKEDAPEDIKAYQESVAEHET